MTYVAQGLKIHSVTINGTDFTNSFINFQCADSSADRRGIITTRGQITLTWSSGFNALNEYKRRTFIRGSLVIVNLKDADGSVVRHPRGHLYVIAVSFNPENDALSVEVGCRLALLEISSNASNDVDVSNLLAIATYITLRDEQISFNNISAALSMEGAVLYQDNNGTLVKRQFFPSSVNNGGTIPGAWTSVLGTTLLSATPLTTADPLPDTLKITTSLPSKEFSDTFGNIQTDTTVTKYYIRFPMKEYVRIPPNNGIAGVEDSSAFPKETNFGAGDCGNTPAAPEEDEDNNWQSCSKNYEAKDVVRYFLTTKTNIQESRYTAPGGQLSRVTQVSYGPALEVNAQYYTDKYAYCITSYSSRCNLTGSCQAGGDIIVTQGLSETVYYYNEDNSVRSTVTRNYQNVGYAAQPTDWRASTEDSDQGWTSSLWQGSAFELRLESGELYLDSLQIDEYFYYKEGTKQVTTSYASAASEGIGIKDVYNIDARNGMKTVQTRYSKTININPDAPERIDETEEQVETRDITLSYPVLFNTYTPSLAEVQELIVQESLPIDLLTTYKYYSLSYQRSAILLAVALYSKYLISWIKGNAFGMTLSEPMRREIIDNWYPGVSFYYYDPVAEEALVASLDASSWAVGINDSAVTFKAVWLANIGTYTYNPGDNTTGSQVRPTHV